MRPIFCGADGHRDFVSGFDNVSGPANPGQLSWSEGLRNPTLDISLFALHVDFNFAVRIGPKKFSDRTLQRDRISFIVGGSPVMGEHRRAKRQHADRPNQKALKSFCCAGHRIHFGSDWPNIHLSVAPSNKSAPM